MSYTVFALKWRPQTFAEIVGQDHIVNTLSNAITKNRLAHAYLFAGPRGVGKTSTARILARAINCQQGPTPSPCGVCSACQNIAKGSSLDVIEIDGASNRGIDEIRTLRENVKFAPAQGRYKVYIIDEVHQITIDGFNALLKTLEEPPEFVKFVFATTNPNKVPQTILSRCQRLDFRRISVMEIIQQLEKIIKAEKLEVDKDVLVAIARSSDGALRDAESILDQLVAFARDKVSLEDVTSMLGLVEQSVLFDLTEKIIGKDARGALALLNRIIQEGKDPGMLLAHLVEHFRNLMIAKVAQADAQLIDLPQEICQKLLQQSGGLSLEEIFNAFSVLQGAQDMAKRLDSLRIPLEICLVRLTQDTRRTKGTSVDQAALRPASSGQPQPARPAAAPARPSTTPPRSSGQAQPARSAVPLSRPAAPVRPSEPPSRPAAAPAKPPAAPERQTLVKEKPHQASQSSLEESGPAAQATQLIQAISLESVKESWQLVIDSLKSVKMSVATFLSEGNPVAVKGDMVTIAFPRNCSLHKEALEDRDNKILVEQNMSDTLNNPCRLHFVLSNEESASIEDQHPLLRSALETFNARLVKED